MSPCCDLNLEDSKQFLFNMILWLMTLHHHTMFGNKMLCGSEDIIQTNMHWQFMMLYYQTKFGCKWTGSLED